MKTKQYISRYVLCTKCDHSVAQHSIYDYETESVLVAQLCDKCYDVFTCENPTIEVVSERKETCNAKETHQGHCNSWMS